jgi:undecaprenyl-diphosphatase
MGSGGAGDPPQREVSPAARSATTYVVVAAALIVCALLLVLLWAPLIDLDHEVTHALVIPGHGDAVQVLEIVTAAASGVVRLVATMLTVGWLVLTRRLALAAFVGTVSAATPLAVELLKRLINRSRPGWPDTAFVPGMSFPSGHSSGAAMMGGALVVVLAATVGARAARRAVPFAIAFAVLIGYTRIALGAHFLGDVIAGWLLGGMIVLVTAWLYGLPARQRLGAEATDR